MQQSAEYDILYFADCYVFIIFATKIASPAARKYIDIYGTEIQQ